MNYDHRQSHPERCLCDRLVSNRAHCRRWAAGHDQGRPTLRPLHELPECPYQIFHQQGKGAQA